MPHSLFWWGPRRQSLNRAEGMSEAQWCRKSSRWDGVRELLERVRCSSAYFSRSLQSENKNGDRGVIGGGVLNFLFHVYTIYLPPPSPSILVLSPSPPPRPQLSPSLFRHHNVKSEYWGGSADKIRAIEKLGQGSSPRILHEIASDQIRWRVTEVNIMNNEEGHFGTM